MERNQSIHKFRHKMVTTLQRDLTAIDRQVVKGRAIQTGEGFEIGQSAFLIKNLGVTLQGEGRIEDAGASASTFLGCPFVRCRVGAEKEAWVTAGGRPAQGLSVTFPFGHGEAIKIAAQPASKHRVAVDVEMGGGDGGGEMTIS